MPYRYYIQKASYEESEDPVALFFSEQEWQRALAAVRAQSPQAALEAFTFTDGYASFEGEEWTDADPRVETARKLAQELEARIFGEEDEEYV